jgi:hypothetical protein
MQTSVGALASCARQHLASCTLDISETRGPDAASHEMRRSCSLCPAPFDSSRLTRMHMNVLDSRRALSGCVDSL